MRTLFDDLAQLRRLDAAIERQAADVGHFHELVSYHGLHRGTPARNRPAIDEAAEVARWQSARRRLCWMEALRARFAGAVNEALRHTPSPFS